MHRSLYGKGHDERWVEYYSDIKNRLLSDQPEEVCDAVHGAGEHTTANQTESANGGNSMEKQTKADGNLSKLSYYRHRVFPGMELYENYPLLVKHKFLIPAYWFYRIVRMLFSKKRRNYILREVKAVKRVAAQEK